MHVKLTGPYSLLMVGSAMRTNSTLYMMMENHHIKTPESRLARESKGGDLAAGFAKQRHRQTFQPQLS